MPDQPITAAEVERLTMLLDAESQALAVSKAEVERLTANLQTLCQDQCDDEAELRAILGVGPEAGQGMSVLVEIVGERLRAGPLAALAAWQDAAGKARSCQVYHDNGYGAVAGWTVSLNEGKRTIEVTGWHVQQARASDAFGTLPEVIAEALSRWEAKP